MKTLSRDNARQLLRELAASVDEAGSAGLPLASMEAVDAYLSGFLATIGPYVVVLRQGVVFIARQQGDPPKQLIVPGPVHVPLIIEES